MDHVSRSHSETQLGQWVTGIFRYRISQSGDHLLASNRLDPPPPCSGQSRIVVCRRKKNRPSSTTVHCQLLPKHRHLRNDYPENKQRIGFRMASMAFGISYPIGINGRAAFCRIAVFIPKYDAGTGTRFRISAAELCQ